MDSVKGIGGWVTAVMVSLTLTLVLLVVEREIQSPVEAQMRAPGTVDKTAASTRPSGIVLAVDPGLIATEQFPPADRTPVIKTQPDAQRIATVLAAPPEPAAQVVLRAPNMSDLDSMALLSNSSEVDQLMDAMDKAFESPIQTASTKIGQTVVKSDNEALKGAFPQRSVALGPAEQDGKFPLPRGLIDELQQLQLDLTPTSHQFSSAGHTIDIDSEIEAPRLKQRRLVSASLTEANLIANWIPGVVQTLNRLPSLSNREAIALDSLVTLKRMSDEAQQLAINLTDADLASRVMRIGYSIARRVAVWEAVANCLDGSASVPQLQPVTLAARQHLTQTLLAIEKTLAGSGDAAAWRNYLMIEPLRNWMAADQVGWEQSNTMALNALSRLRWERLNKEQQAFLDQPEFKRLAEQLEIWACRPVDYRQLLNDLELLEQDPVHRVRHSLAGNVQVLRLANEPHQRAVAEALNDHYRNANIRLAVAGKLLERFLPSESYQTRPVSQKILGANTRGDSVVRTSLSLKLIPDDSAWHVGLGVQGDVYSNTRSSKGPAIFHNSSTAQVATERAIRLDINGYKIENNGTAVDSHQVLRKMSTDLDGLPVIGDFFRLIVREQFDQQRPIAKRVMHRILAEQTDAELDKQLQERMTKAQDDLERLLVGPLEALNLNPMVVSMNTTEERLLIRYRVANQHQMAAHTARPRAPSDSLLSMQVHQSAFNNTLSQLELGDRTWNLLELFEKFGEAFGQKDWKAPGEIPDNVLIRFAPSRPITVEMADGQLILTLRINELSHGEHRFERFIIRSTYIPVADGLKAGLVRDGVVSIDGPRLGMRERLPLRAIFTKVFVSKPEIPLISETLAADKRAEGLAVSQIEVRDGWLALAISDSESPLAAEVANRSREWQTVR